MALTLGLPLNEAVCLTGLCQYNANYWEGTAFEEKQWSPKIQAQDAEWALKVKKQDGIRTLRVADEGSTECRGNKGSKSQVSKTWKTHYIC